MPDETCAICGRDFDYDNEGGCIRTKTDLYICSKCCCINEDGSVTLMAPERLR